MVVSGLFFRYQIYTTGVPGMTTQQARQTHGTTAQRAMAFDGGNRITGAGGIKTAMTPKPGAEQKSVTAYQLDDEPAHLSFNSFQRFSKDSFSAFFDWFATPVRPSTTISSAPRDVCQ